MNTALISTLTYLRNFPKVTSSSEKKKEARVLPIWSFPLPSRSCFKKLRAIRDALLTRGLNCLDARPSGCPLYTRTRGDASGASPLIEREQWTLVAYKTRSSRSHVAFHSPRARREIAILRRVITPAIPLSSRTQLHRRAPKISQEARRERFNVIV